MLMHDNEFLDICVDLFIDGHKSQGLIQVV